MHSKLHSAPPLIINEGYFIDIHYDDYNGMIESAKNWKQYCTYQLHSNALKGHNRILQLRSMQIGYVERPGGFMYNTSSPKDCLSFGVIEKCTDKACFDNMKIQTGDIVFFDDGHSLNFMTNDAIKLSVVNIKKESMQRLLPEFTKALYHTIQDANGVMTKTLHDIWERCTGQENQQKNKNVFRHAEKEIIDLLIKMLKEQTPLTPKLTKGEKKALKIRDHIYHHMDAKIDINSLAKQYKISKKTLHNSFLSLFGFTPGHFIRQLKLNLVHNELKERDPKQTSVTRVAQKWGFSHMGHFAAYYEKLFKELPSHTLQKNYSATLPLEENACVSRHEEMA